MTKSGKSDNFEQDAFRCGYCGFDGLVPEPFKIHLPPDEWFYAEDPMYGDTWLVTEEEEEGYRCMVCGNHLSTEETFWGQFPDSMYSKDPQ